MGVGVGVGVLVLDVWFMVGGKQRRWSALNDVGYGVQMGGNRRAAK